MSKWETVRLGDYIQEYSERNKDDSEIPVYSVTNSNGFCAEYFSKEVASKDKTTYKIVKNGYFAYNPSRINVGSVDWLREEETVIVSPLYNVFSVKSDLYQQYLYYYLKSPVGLYYIKELATGSVRDNLKLSTLAEFSISLPPLEIQKQIASTLDKVTHTIDICNQIIEKLDLLVKARFVEIFGEPILNQKGWKMATIGDIVTEVKYGTSRPAVDGGKYPYLRMNNLTYDGQLDLTDLKRIDIPENEIVKCIVRKGDVLFNRTNSVELVGKTCVFNENEDMVIAGYIIRVRLKPVMLPIVLSCFMNTDALKKKLKNIAKGAVNQANINAQELQRIEIYIPPIELQEQFADFVEQTDKSKSAVKQVLEKAETLKKALMQEYFR
ncbi:MAG: restriction endonuclease subunit S [Oscillospiraceae bacterium]|nr:restriction endonuclease subunit S [Oscillospiraceae bacterium]